MASIANLVSYELNGVKESFANWISNISPTDTPFVSMTGKESITNKYFQWQHDSLGAVGPNAFAEGSDASDATLVPTGVEKNVTQILRKVIQVSDTADALSSYGRGSELAYQMEKAGAEIKRDLEFAFLNQGVASEGVGPYTGTATVTPAGTAYAPGIPGQGDSTMPTSAQLNGTIPATTLNFVRKTAGFQGLVSTADAPDSVGAGSVKVRYTQVAGDIPTNVTTGNYGFKEETLFNLTANPYQVGATPSIIMFHPSQAKTFSSLMEASGAGVNRQRMFDGAEDTKINTYVSILVDPLGQEFKLIPNRFMPKDQIYLFDPADWTQMVLRAPMRTKLAKTGSFEKWMIEMEVGLRHRNPWASGVLTLLAKA